MPGPNSYRPPGPGRGQPPAPHHGDARVDGSDGFDRGAGDHNPQSSLDGPPNPVRIAQPSPPAPFLADDADLAPPPTKRLRLTSPDVSGTDPYVQQHQHFQSQARLQAEIADTHQQHIDALNEQTQIALAYQQDAQKTEQQAKLHQNWKQHVREAEQGVSDYQQQAHDSQQDASEYQQRAQWAKQWTQEAEQRVQNNPSQAREHEQEARRYRQWGERVERQAHQADQEAQAYLERAKQAEKKAHGLRQLGADGHERAAEHYRQRAVDLGWHAKDEVARIRDSSALSDLEDAEKSLTDARRRERAYRLLGEHFDTSPIPFTQPTSATGIVSPTGGGGTSSCMTLTLSMPQCASYTRSHNAHKSTLMMPARPDYGSTTARPEHP